MKEHGILFSGPMVRSLLSGQKTETRRTSSRWAKAKPGDRLWVREAMADHEDGGICYRADDVSPDDKVELVDNRWTPGIHMKRSACRLVLELGEIRQERLQDIDEAGAVREGMMTVTMDDLVKMSTTGRVLQLFGLRNIRGEQDVTIRYLADIWGGFSAVDRFGTVFALLNGFDAWERNDLVWVLGGLQMVK